ncbi:hypothetical protein [Mycolicibacter hiberniae]|uniref:Uncharacterized protein n=1 Tax=Mycolicibacter hiberniae TaxID=29314 RepID=A0A7I7X6E7_9MYCO|nr:hypothetical protein [Mycolicibacter hiberniae]MCV7087374.1 hypothetical protein [Mycolicibacter hiberniae]BBZ25409.1 hypothetical protein MHIB_38270 [Mycolicibacter hiberniae]
MNRTGSPWAATVAHGMSGALVTAALAVFGAALGAAPAEAAPRCLFQGDWNCEGPPPYHGPLLPTWNAPGTYGGWTTNPVQCDVVTRQCRQVMTKP